jgi:hypothetical protein
MAQTKQILANITTLVRELPLADYLAQLPAGDASRATIEALLGVQRTLPAIAPNIVRGPR